jgi:cellobiose phosphorylase
LHVTKRPDDIADAEGKYLYIDDGDGVYCPTYAPLFENPSDYAAEFFREKCVYTNRARGCSHTIRVPSGFNGEIHSFKIENKSDVAKKLTVNFFGGSIVLGDYTAYESHKTFYNMFITAARRGENLFEVKRKSMRADGKSYYAAMLVKGVEARPEFNRRNFIGGKNTLKNPSAVFGRRVSGRTEDAAFLSRESAAEAEGADFPPLGDALEPCFGFNAEITLNAGGSREFSVIIAAAEDEGEIERLIRRAGTFVFDKLIGESPELVWLDSAGVLSDGEYDVLTEILPSVVDSALSQSKLRAVLESGFLDVYKSYSDNFRTKLLYYAYNGRADDFDFVSVLKVFNVIKNAGINVRLLISAPKDIYHDPLRHEINRYVRDFSRGVAVVGESEEIESFLKKTAFLDLNQALKEPYCTTETADKKRSIRESYGDIRRQYTRENAALAVGSGYFTDGGDFVVDKPCVLPHSNVVGLPEGGFVATENGGGFSFFGNSRENKVSVMHNDPVSDTPSERLFLFDGKSLIRINKGGTYARHKNGETVFYNDIGGRYGCAASQYMIDGGRVKIFEIAVENMSDESVDMTLIIEIEPCLGDRQRPDANLYKYSHDTASVADISNGQTAALRVYGGEIIKNAEEIRGREGRFFAPDYDGGGGEKGDKDSRAPSCNKGGAECAFAAKYDFRLKAGKTKRFFFALAKSEEFLDGLDIDDLKSKKQSALSYFDGFNAVKIETGDERLDMLFNKRLIYQLVSSRINARCGFYQAGGAIGFRDQLQDYMALVYSRPDLLRSHILLSASKQYAEGDVMHWWHPPLFGVRTKISDDKLFLPYAAIFYVEATGDYSILNEEIEYVSSPPLSGFEHARLEVPEATQKKAPLIEHIERAIQSAMQFGEHGLLLMGAGDWNDALDNVGIKGRGESVWLSMFMYRVLTGYKGLFEIDDRLKYSEYELKLKKAVESAGFDVDRFKRAFTDDGEWLGGRMSKNCRLDLLCQSWAALSGIACPQRAKKALDSAAALVDKRAGIVKLFDPPFDGEGFYGYISSYPKGIRENGGQYTHAVLWYISALFKSGRADEAYAVLNMINPVTRAADGKYLGEPYAVAADVSLGGRAGWSWYTGSAGLMYRVILEDMIGITLKNNCLVIKPVLPSSINCCRVEYRYKNAVYNIEIKRGTQKEFLVNGIKITNNNSVALKESGSLSIVVAVGSNDR